MIDFTSSVQMLVCFCNHLEQKQWFFISCLQKPPLEALWVFDTWGYLRNRGLPTCLSSPKLYSRGADTNLKPCPGINSLSKSLHVAKFSYSLHCLPWQNDRFSNSYNILSLIFKVFSLNFIFRQINSDSDNVLNLQQTWITECLFSFRLSREDLYGL